MARWLPPLSVFLVLAALSVALRAPTFPHSTWNLDEAIHATVARELLAGGALYRDAIDQRTPLTYYAVAGIFAVAGENNLAAVRIATALLIAATSLLLWLAARAWRRGAAGAWAAGLYVLLSIALPYRGDAFAFNTEWMLAAFTALAAWLVSRGVATGRTGWFAGAGAALGAAFLSKQPALLDAGAAVALLLYLAWRRPADIRPLAGRALALAAGWTAVVGAAVLGLAAQGALRDAVFYAWTYNVVTYGPEIAAGERLASAAKLVAMFRDGAPLVLPWVVIALAGAAFRVAQRAPTPEEATDNPWRAFLLAWTATSLAGAASGGRAFDHYFIQALPPLCLLTGLLADQAGRLVLAPHRRALARMLAALALGATALTLGNSVLAQRARTLAADSSERTARAVRQLTAPEERIFVWGFHPDIHVLSDRRAATRFVYSSFVTGLVPWTNTAPERDTSYAIVPGALETLLRELETRRPAMIVDCSMGPNRSWQKYPLGRFPALRAFVDRHYVRVDPDQFSGQGYGLYLIRDESRRQAVATSGSLPASLDEPQWFGPTAASAEPTDVTLVGSCARGRLTGLELLIGGEVQAAVSFAPVESLKVRVSVPFDRFGSGRHTLQVRATGADGSRRISAETTVAVESGRLTPAQAAAFALPQVASRNEPVSVSAVYGASAGDDGGVPTFFAHAPSSLVYALPAGARAIAGGFGFREGAHAADNRFPTDGAEFRIDLVGGDGRRRTLLRRLLRPTTEAADRGSHAFRADLPPDRAGGERLEFTISAGPAGNPASDWTFWTALRLENSP